MASCFVKKFVSIVLFFAFSFFGFSSFSQEYQKEKEVLSLKEIDALIKKTSYDQALLELKKYGEKNPIQFDAVQSRINKIIRRRDDYSKDAAELADIILNAQEGADNSELLEKLAHKLLVNEMDPNDRNLDKIKDVHKLAARSQFKAIQNKTHELIAEEKYNEALDKSSQTFQTFREYFDREYFETQFQKDIDSWISSVQLNILQIKDKTFQDRMKIVFDLFIASLRTKNPEEIKTALQNVQLEFGKYADLRNKIFLEGKKIYSSFEKTAERKNEDCNQFLRYAAETILSQNSPINCGIISVLDSKWQKYVEAMKKAVFESLKESSINFAYSNEVQKFSPETHIVPSPEMLSYICFASDVGIKVNGLYDNLLQADYFFDLNKKIVPFENYDISLSYLSDLSKEAVKLIDSLTVMQSFFQEADSYPVPTYSAVNIFEKVDFAQEMISASNKITESGKSINLNSSDTVSWKNNYRNLIKKLEAGESFQKKLVAILVDDNPLVWNEIENAFENIDKVSKNYSQDLSALIWKKIAIYFLNSSNDYVFEAQKKKLYIENYVTGKNYQKFNNSDDSDKDVFEISEKYPVKALEEAQKFNIYVSDKKNILRSCLAAFDKGIKEKSDQEIEKIKENEEMLSLFYKDINEGSLLKTAKSLAKKAVDARNEAESFIKETRIELKKDNWAKAYENLSEAGVQISLALQNDADIKFSDGSPVKYDLIGQLEKEISSRAEEVVSAFVMEQKQKANKEINSGNYEAAVDCLASAKNRLLQAKLPEDPDLKRLLDFVEKANSMEEGRKLNLYDPLYKEMSGILSEATMDFEEGKKILVSSGKNHAEEKTKGMEKLFSARKRLDDLLLVYPLNQDASFLKLQIEQYENPVEFEESFASRVEKAKKDFTKAPDSSSQTDAYYVLSNLARLKPNDKKLARFIYDAEIKIGKRRPEIKNTNIVSARKHYESALKIFKTSKNDVNKLNKALAEADESLRLNPVNGDSKLYSESFTLYNNIRKQINVLRPREMNAADRALYYKAYDLASERQYARAMRIIEPLRQKYPDNVDINELYDDLKGRV